MLHPVRGRKMNFNLSSQTTNQTPSTLWTPTPSNTYIECPTRTLLNFRTYDIEENPTCSNITVYNYSQKFILWLNMNEYQQVYEYNDIQKGGYSMWETKRCRTESLILY